MNKLIITNKKSNKKNNFSPKEWTELKDLTKNRNILTREDAVTVPSKHNYLGIICKHFNN